MIQEQKHFIDIRKGTEAFLYSANGHQDIQPKRFHDQTYVILGNWWCFIFTAQA